MQNKTVVSLLMDNQHITQQVRQDTLDMLIVAGYNLHKDSWTPPPSARSASSTPRKDTGSVLPSRAPSASRLPQQGAGQVHGASATVSPAEVMAAWLDKRKQDLPTLTCLCRTRVRKRLSYCNKGRSIMDVLPRLPLPPLLLSYITLKGEAAFQQDWQDNC